MNTAVYKYPLGWGADGQVDLFVALPKGARILRATRQSKDIVLYALVDPTLAPSIPVGYRVVATGEQVEGLDKMEYLSTVRFPTDVMDFFFHVFVEKNRVEAKT